MRFNSEMLTSLAMAPPGWSVSTDVASSDMPAQPVLAVEQASSPKQSRPAKKEDGRISMQRKYR